MSICTSFEGALMKAIRSLEQNMYSMLLKGLESDTTEEIREKLHRIDDRRLFVIAEAIRRGISYEEIHDITKIDIWFLDKIAVLTSMEARLKTEPMTRELMLEAKRLEFPDSDGAGEIDIDAQIPPAFVTPGLLDIAARFEPFGEDNAPLQFLVCGVKIIGGAIIGKGEKQHIKLTLDCGKFKWPALFWNAAERYGRDFSCGDKVDAVFQVTQNFYNGTATPQMIITDLRRTEQAPAAGSASAAGQEAFV